MNFLRQGTAATAVIGPFLSAADGLTPVTTLVLAEDANASLVSNGAGSAFVPSSWTHIANGHYAVGLTAAHTANCGELRLDYSNPGSYGAVYDDWVVLPQAIYDSLILGILPIPTITPGAYSVAVTVKNPSNVPLAGAQVSVWSWSGSATVAALGWMNTNSLGVAAFNLPPGTYTLLPVLNGYTFAAPSSLVFTVAASPVSQSVTATPASPVGTPAPGQCLVYGTLYDASATPISGVEIDFFADCPQGVGSDLMTSSILSIVTGPTATNPSWPAGYFQIEMHQGANVRLSSSLPKLNGLVVQVPGTTTATLASLVEAALAS